MSFFGCAPDTPCLAFLAASAAFHNSLSIRTLCCRMQVNRVSRAVVLRACRRQSAQHGLISSVSQSVSQPISQSASQSVGSHSISQSVSQSIIQSHRQSVNQPFNHSFSQSFSQSVSHSVSQPVSHSVNQSISQSVSQSVSQSIRISQSLGAALRWGIWELNYCHALVYGQCVTLISSQNQVQPRGVNSASTDVPLGALSRRNAAQPRSTPQCRRTSKIDAPR